MEVDWEKPPEYKISGWEYSETDILLYVPVEGGRGYFCLFVVLS